VKRFSVSFTIAALCLISCSDPGEPQPVNISVPLSIQAFPVIAGTNIRPVLNVDGIDYSATSESNGVIAFQLDLSSDIMHTFSLVIYASRLNQFSDEVIVATIPAESHYISQDDPSSNSFTLNAFEFDHNDDGDMLNNWQEIKLGYNPKLKETSLNPTYVYDNTAINASNDGAYSIAITRDGGWVAAGYTTYNAADDLAIWKFNAQGQLDTSFANNGVFTHNNAAGGNNNDYAYNVAALPNGGWIAVGDSDGTGTTATDMAIWKFNNTGVLDTTFNLSGVFTHNNAAGGNSYDAGRAVCVAADGSWIVTGFSMNAAKNFDMAVWKFNANGDLDSNFDGDGVFTHDSAAGGNGEDRGRDCALTSDGGWVIVGYSANTAGNLDLAIWKFNAAGVLDSNFGNAGVFTQNGAAGGNGDDRAYSIILSADNDWIVAGYSTNSLGNKDMALWKFLPDGTLDSNFASNGVYVHDNAAGGAGDDGANRLAKTNDKGWLVVGYSTNAINQHDMAMWKFNANGEVDQHFGKNGVFTQNGAAGGNARDDAYDVIVRANGEWVVAGQSDNGANYDAVIW